MRTNIWVTTSFVGFHCWPKAPKARAYLRRPHRHVFHVKVTVPVEIMDREVEFHDLKDELNTVIQERVAPWMTAEQKCKDSCEKIAESIALGMNDEYGYKRMKVEVSEDGECGGLVYFNDNGTDAEDAFL